MFAKKLFYASAALFLLAAAFHLGASSATAAKPHDSLVGVTRISDSAGAPFAGVDAAGTVYVESSGSWIVAGHIPGRPVSVVSRVMLKKEVA